MFRFTFICLFGLTCSKAVSADQGTEAIVGGDYARKGDFKYHAVVYGTNGRCGGAIIDDHYILTAAHCVTDAYDHIFHKRFTVVVGTHDRHDEHESILVPVETIYIPKDFSRTAKLHDLAILKLKHSLNISQHHQKLQKILLPKPDANFDTACGIITGFGYQEVKIRKNSHGQLEEYDGKSDGKLKFANVKVITNERCTQLNHRQIPPTNICGQVLQRDKKRPEGACTGDSGGPLVYGDEIIGVLSLSPFACNEAYMAGTYTRVSSYVNLINSVIHGKPGHDVVSLNVLH